MERTSARPHLAALTGSSCSGAQAPTRHQHRTALWGRAAPSTEASSLEGRTGLQDSPALSPGSACPQPGTGDPLMAKWAT